MIPVLIHPRLYYRDPMTFVCYLPVLSRVARFVDITQPPVRTCETEKALVLAHTLVASFFILKFHTSESIAHYWPQLEGEMLKRDVLKMSRHADHDRSSLFDQLVDGYFKLCALCQGDKSLWADLSELWFMGTEALRSSLKNFPELRRRVKESKWLPKAVSNSTKSGHVYAALQSLVEISQE